MKTFKTLFTEHPREVGLSYPRHFLYAFSVMSRLSGCAVACFVHAFFPFLFTHTTSTAVHKLNTELEHRVHPKRI